MQDEHNLYQKHPRRRNAHIEALHINLYPATVLVDLENALIWRTLKQHSEVEDSSVWGELIDR